MKTLRPILSQAEAEEAVLEDVVFLHDADEETVTRAFAENRSGRDPERSTRPRIPIRSGGHRAFINHVHTLMNFLQVSLD